MIGHSEWRDSEFLFDRSDYVRLLVRLRSPQLSLFIRSSLRKPGGNEVPRNAHLRDPLLTGGGI